MSALLLLLDYDGTSLKVARDLKPVAAAGVRESVPVRFWRRGEVRTVQLAAGEPEVEAPALTRGTLVAQTLERPLRIGEVSLDELERAFRETDVEPLPVKSREAREAPKQKVERAEEERLESLVAAQSIRVNVDTLETLPRVLRQHLPPGRRVAVCLPRHRCLGHPELGGAVVGDQQQAVAAVGKPGVLGVVLEAGPAAGLPIFPAM